MSLLARLVDIVAYDEYGQLLLLVVVKAVRQTSGSWAAEYRSNMLSHGTLPRAPFFLIATAEHLFFWRQDDTIRDEDRPQFTLDAVEELKPYFERFDLTPGKTRGAVLEWIYYSWLVDLANSGQSRAQHDASLTWLSESGLLDALKHARIELSTEE